MSDRPSSPATPIAATWGAAASDAAGVVVAVHGRGQTPAYMQTESTRLMAALNSEPTGPRGLSIGFVAPHAPGDSWYPKPFQHPLDENQPDLDAALATVAATLADPRVRDAHRVVVWGFSQGACLLSHYLLTHGCDIDAALLCTGGFCGPDRPPTPTARLDGVPVVLRSIVDDPFVPPDRVRETATALESVGASCDLRIDPGAEHIITDEAMHTMAATIRQVIR